MNTSSVPVVPECAPMMAGARWMRPVGRGLLRLLGWRLVGRIPAQPKLLFIGAPHSSNWDWVVGMAALFSLGMRMTYLIKHSLFFWPLGSILRSTGGVPVDREKAAHLVEAIVDQYQVLDTMYFGLTPEGTRRGGKTLENRIFAYCLPNGVPVVPASFDYPSKTITIGEPIALSGDRDQDLRRVCDYFAPFRGRCV